MGRNRFPKSTVEHLILVLVEFARWIDRRLQKPLARVVPDLDRLLRDPRGTLKQQPVVIGPARRPASLILFTLALTLAGWVVGFVILIVLLGAGAVPRNQRGVPVAVFYSGLLIVLAVSFWLVRRWLRGGQLVLTPEGAELHYRQWVVFLPWAVFNAPGQPFLPRYDHTLLPASRAALPFIELREHDLVRATGLRVKAYPLRIKPEGEVVLRSLYEVPLDDLGPFLLQLGRALGDALPDGSAVPAEAPAPELAAEAPARLEPDGWITARLTRLEFPPFCCDCGAGTDEAEEFVGHVVVADFGRFFRVEGGEFAVLRIPVCGDCRREGQRRSRRAALWGLGLGAGLPLLVSAALVLFDPVALLVLLPLDL